MADDWHGDVSQPAHAVRVDPGGVRADARRHATRVRRLPAGRERPVPRPRHTIHHDAGHPSYLLVPVIPR